MGTAYITYDVKEGSITYHYTIDLGTIVGISRGVSKKTMITPIVSLDMEDAFPIESGNSQTLSISFKRTNVADADDTGRPTSLAKSRGRSNQKWYQELTDTIDRWQARTDGCVLHYSETNSEYIPSFEKGCYIKSINRSYKNDFNELITGTIEFVVGRMYLNDPSLDTSIEDYPDDQNYEKMRILMSNAARNVWYLLMSGAGYSCVDSVTISAGSEQSFEHIDITMPKKKLMEMAPGLINDITSGANEIRIDMMGSHNMIVAKVDTGDEVTLRAYCRAWLYESSTTSSELYGDAWFIIHQILTDGSYGVNFSEDQIIFSFSKDIPFTNMTIPAGDNVWKVLQICAYSLRCKIFFADDKAYIVDYTALNPNDNGTMHTSDARYGKVCTDFFSEPIVLFTDDSESPLYGRCLGKTKLGKEGIDPLKNSLRIRCTDTPGTPSTNYEVKRTDSDSISTYGEVNPGIIDLPELAEGTVDDVVYSQASNFADNYLVYLREPQRSVTFSLKEAYHSQGTMYRVWKPYFGVSARVAEIRDEYSGEVVTNRSMLDNHIGEHMPQKLTLSSYKRQYPRGVCEYTFGTISEISLPASTSVMNTAINSKR